MQVLFQFDLRGPDYAAELGGTIADLCATELRAGDSKESDGGKESNGPRKPNAAEREIVAFATHLVEGTLQRRDEIDAQLQGVTRNWDLRRMAIVDRNVLRMATYELMFCADVPPKVAINEAIEIGKKYSTANTGGFVNGILDRIRIDLERARELRDAEGSNADESSADESSGSD